MIYTQTPFIDLQLHYNLDNNADVYRQCMIIAHLMHVTAHSLFHTRKYSNVNENISMCACMVASYSGCMDLAAQFHSLLLILLL